MRPQSDPAIQNLILTVGTLAILTATILLEGGLS